VGLHSGNTCSFIFKVTLLTLSSLHMEYIPYVVMPTFKEGHIPTKYLIKDQVAPEHFWGLMRPHRYLPANARGTLLPPEPPRAAKGPHAHKPEKS
jgi:hypothetical protein